MSLNLLHKKMEGLSEWYVSSILTTYESEARHKRLNEEKLSLQSDHERLIGLLTREGISTDQPIAVVLRACEKINDPLIYQFRFQWEQHVDRLYRDNCKQLDACAADEPDYFREFCDKLTFDTCYKNPLWKPKPGESEASLLSTKKPLRPKRQLETLTVEIRRAPKSTDIQEFVRLLNARAKARAKYEELSFWHTTRMTSWMERFTKLTNATRTTGFAVQDDTKAPDAESQLKALITKTRGEWKEAFAEDDKEQVADALKQLTQESSALETKNHVLLTSTPSTLDYLSTYLTYLVAKSVEETARVVAALVRAALAGANGLKSRAEERVCLDQERKVKRARVEDPERKDIRGAIAWLTKLDAEANERLEKLRQATPTTTDFEDKRDKAYSFAIYIDYAIWAQNVLKHSDGILKAMEAVAPVPTYIQWLQEHERQVRERAATEIDAVRRQAVAVTDSVCTRLKDTDKWYSDFVAELRNIQADADRDLIVCPKPWNDKPVSNTQDLVRVFDVPATKELPDAPLLLAATRDLLSKRSGIEVATYRSLQVAVEHWLLGVMGLWLCEE